MTLLFLLIKYFAESAWCLVSLRRQEPAAFPDIRNSLRYGLVRLLAGRGALLLMHGVPVLTKEPEWVLYCLLLLVRWLLWSLVDEIVKPGPRSLGGFLLGRDAWSRRWRAGGVCISSLADLPELLAGSWTGDLWP